MRGKYADELTWSDKGGDVSMFVTLVSMLTTECLVPSVKYRMRGGGLLQKHKRTHPLLHCVHTGILVACCRTYLSSPLLLSKSLFLFLVWHPSNGYVVWNRKAMVGTAKPKVFLKPRLWNCLEVSSLGEEWVLPCRFRIYRRLAATSISLILPFIWEP